MTAWGDGHSRLAVRLYRWGLKVLAPDLYDTHGEEAVGLFAKLHRDARRSRGHAGATWHLVRSWASLVGGALRSHREARRIDSRSGGRTAGGEMMGVVWQDLRYGLRSMIKQPGFALTAVGILAVGIGATTTIFSVVDTVVLRPLPYPGAGRLVHFDKGAHSYPSYRAWRDMDSFESVVAARDFQVDLTGEGAPRRLPAIAVSEDFFRMFGGAPHLGRLFTADDYPGDRSVAVLGYGLFERLGSDPDLVGRELRIDGRPTLIAGVLNPDFVPPVLETGSRVDIWYPLDDGGADRDDHGFHVLGVAARLAPGVSLEAAQAEVDAQRAAVSKDVPLYYVDRDGRLLTTPLVPMREATVKHVRATLYLLLGAVGMMLLIACANVANLFLARGTARTREVALRAALGAGRGRIVSQILVESLLLAAVGGVLGAALAFGGTELLTKLLPGDIPRIDGLAVDGRVLLFTLSISVLTGALFGTFPSLQSTKTDINTALKEGSAATTAGMGGRRARSGLVVLEVALAMVLLTGAGLLFRSLIARLQVEPGFDEEGLVVMPLELEAGYDVDRRTLFVDDLRERIEAMPGTESVTMAWTIPFTFTGASRCCWRSGVYGDPALTDEEHPLRSYIHPVTSSYFSTLHARVAAGRDFRRSDETPGSAAAIVNRETAEALFGGTDVVGRTLELGDDRLEVVGVVDGVHHWGLSQDIGEAIYVPWSRFGADYRRLQVLVRTSVPLGVAAPALRAAVWGIDADLPIGTVTTMEKRVSESLVTPRFLSEILGAFAALSLVLACGGVYGTMLYTVGQRRREMGIRLALGAGAGSVVRMILGSGMILAVGGVVLGVVTAWQLSRFLEGLVWGIEVTDPTTFASTAAALALTALAASLVPAWQAARTDPLETLRAE